MRLSWPLGFAALALVSSVGPASAQYPYGYGYGYGYGYNPAYRMPMQYAPAYYGQPYYRPVVATPVSMPTYYSGYTEGYPSYPQYQMPTYTPAAPPAMSAAPAAPSGPPPATIPFRPLPEGTTVQAAPDGSDANGAPESPKPPTLPSYGRGPLSNHLPGVNLLGPSCADGACQAPSCPAPACPTNNCPQQKYPKILAFGEYLYWTVHNGDVPYAQAFDGTDPFNSVPRGQVGSVSPRFGSGFRAGLGAAIDPNSWIVGTMTYFRDTSSNSLNAPPGDVLHNFLVFPNTINAAGDSLSAGAQTATTLVTGDLDYKHAFINTPAMTLSWLAEARYGHLNQSLNADYSIFGKTNIDSQINFDGAGPRAGLDGQYRVFGGFYGYGKGAANLLAGQFRANYTETNTFTGLVGNTGINSARVVPVLEMELGAGWTSPKGRLRFSGGYYVGTWFNTINTPTLANSIQSTNFSNNGGNFSDTTVFDGFVGRLEFRY